MSKHDASYRLLFSHPRMVEDLLRGFLGEEWLSRLDFSTLERVNASYVSGGLERREADVVWRLRCTDGDGVLYLYLLLEFQSDVQRLMAFRVLGYVALLYRDLIARKELTPSGKLPQVLPIVIYNGEERWWAPLEVSELIEAVSEPDLPRLRYRVIDEGSYPLPELEKLRNLTAILFRLEKSRERDEIQRGILELAEALGDPDEGSLRRAFLVWLEKVLLLDRRDDEEIPETLGLQEFRTMLENRVREWNRELREEGRAEGRREGKAEGRREGKAEGRREGEAEGRRQGEAELLLRQLERRFGPLDPSTRSLVERAGSERLLEWGERFATAVTLADVFGE